jgi:uncharacterized protein YdiU (UPF0061 family)
VIGEYFPQFVGDYAGWFGEVVKRTAQLMADWQAVGFAHGVMNTDNMSILGLTLDYGPFGFVEAYDPGLICNHTDEKGRYAFDNQPGIGHWNLRALAVALSGLIATEALVERMGSYEAYFVEHYRARMRAKFGLVRGDQGDDKLMGALLGLMVKARVDYTLIFRALSRLDESWLALFGVARDEAHAWVQAYRARLAGDGDRVAAMNAVNPKYVLRNWVAETAIRAVEDRGDVATMDRILTMLQSPFDEQPQNAEFAAPPPPALCGLEVSCSS